jgi:hypothetical protein
VFARTKNTTNPTGNSAVRMASRPGSAPGRVVGCGRAGVAAARVGDVDRDHGPADRGGGARGPGSPGPGERDGEARGVARPPDSDVEAVDAGGHTGQAGDVAGEASGCRLNFQALILPTFRASTGLVSRKPACHDSLIS